MRPAVPYLLLADDKTYRCRNWHRPGRATRLGDSSDLEALGVERHQPTSLVISPLVVTSQLKPYKGSRSASLTR
jgi:hypothetical protein